MKNQRRGMRIDFNAWAKAVLNRQYVFVGNRLIDIVADDLELIYQKGYDTGRNDEEVAIRGTMGWE